MRRIVPILLVLLLAPAAIAGAASRTFTTHLTGAAENPPNDSAARGQAVIKISKDGSELSFRLIVANIENVTQAHIHCGGPEDNGSVALWLYPDGPPPQLIQGRTDGVLASGTRTDDDVVAVADSPICPGGISSLDDLIDKITSGLAYVNVHTSQFPPGEIRGQL